MQEINKNEELIFINPEQLTILQKDCSELKNVIKTNPSSIFEGRDVYPVKNLENIVITDTDTLNKELLRVSAHINFMDGQQSPILQLIEKGILPKSDTSYVLDYYQQHLAKKYNQIEFKWQPSL